MLSILVFDVRLLVEVNQQTSRLPQKVIPSPSCGKLVFLVLALIRAGYSSEVAGSKGHEKLPWFFGGILFGPLALLASLGLPDLKTRKYLRLLAEHQGALSPQVPSSLTGGDEDSARSGAESSLKKPASLRDSLDEAGF